MSIALITGGSAGLGRELVTALAQRGWTVITDARDAARLSDLNQLGVTALAGDITDADHQDQLFAAVHEHSRLDLLVHNASTLGPLPMRELKDVTIEELRHVWQTNLGSPLVITGRLLPYLIQAQGILLSISSDAGVAHYPTWGLYGASKAGLDHVTLTFGAENDAINTYAVDPGDMRTAMHQDAFPGEDISDRPLPATVVPSLFNLIEQRPPNGRYRASDFASDFASEFAAEEAS